MPSTRKTTRKAPSASRAKQPDRPGDTKTVAVSLYGPEIEILERELERHREMGSRVTTSSLIRWLLHHGNVEEMPPSY